MNIGNYITIGLLLLIGYGTLRVYISDVKGLKASVKELWDAIDEVRKEQTKMAVSIGRLETILNNRRK